MRLPDFPLPRTTSLSDLSKSQRLLFRHSSNTGKRFNASPPPLTIRKGIEYPLPRISGTVRLSLNGTGLLIWLTLKLFKLFSELIDVVTNRVELLVKFLRLIAHALHSAAPFIEDWLLHHQPSPTDGSCKRFGICDALAR
jgi:hypothetical protein